MRPRQILVDAGSLGGPMADPTDILGLGLGTAYIDNGVAAIDKEEAPRRAEVRGCRINDHRVMLGRRRVGLTRVMHV